MPLKRFSALAIVAVALCLQVCGVARADDRSEFSQLERRFAHLYNSARYEEAQQVADRQLVLAKRSVRDNVPMTYHRVGLCQLSRGKYEEAVGNLQRSLDAMQRVRPSHPDLRAQFDALRGINYNCLGQCYFNLARYDEAVQNYERSIDWYQRLGQPAQAAVTLINLADLYYRRADYERAEREYAKIVEILEPAASRERPPANFTTNLAIALGGLGDISQRMGRYRQAEAQFRRALELKKSVTGWEHPAVATILNDMAIFYGSQGDWEDAESYWREALRLHEKFLTANHVVTARTEFNLGHLALLRGDWDEAKTRLEQALSVLEPGRGAKHPETAVVVRDLGTVEGKRGNAAMARQLLARSLETLETTLNPLHPDVALTLAEMAELELDEGNYNEVMKLTDRALAIGEQNYLQDSVVAHLRRLRAQALWKSKKPKDALHELDQAIERIEMQRTLAMGAERERAQLLANYMKSYILKVEWQAELGDPAETFKAMEAMKSRTFLDELALKNVDLLADIPDEQRDQMVAREKQLRQAVTDAEATLYALPAPKKNAPDQELEQKLRTAATAVAQARRKLYEHLVEMRHASPKYQQVVSGRREFTPLAEVQKSLLGPGELMLDYNVSAEGGLVVLAVRRDEARIYRVELDESLAGTLGIPAGPLTAGKLSYVLSDEKTGVVPALSEPKTATTKNAQLRALWKALVPEEIRTQLAGGKISRLTIIPSGALATLPFETLIVSDEGQQKLQYLLDAGPPIVYAPSATVLSTLAARTSAKVADASPAVLTVGDPAYPQLASEKAADDRLAMLPTSGERLRSSLSRLPYSGDEARRLEQLFAAKGIGVTSLLGGAATEAAVRRLAPGREILHFACHGMVDQRYANFYGALAFVPGKAGDPDDDGYLSMSEIYGLDLDACQLAILSACETNHGPRHTGEGVWALSRGFLLAGARRVVASNWVVSDPAAARLVPEFAEQIAASTAKGEAPNYALYLQQAKRSIRNQPKWSNPFFWAPLVLVGVNQ